jgi:hypothetical protein
MRWADWICKAMRNLGGTATYDELYAELRRIRPPPFSADWKATVRQTVERHSSDSENYREGNENLFYSVGGIGSGHWGLRGKL